MQETRDTQYKTLQTPRLLLRQLRNSDASQIFSLRTDPHVNEYIDRTVPVNIAEATEFITKINEGINNKESFYWAITFKNDDLLVGTICIWNINRDEGRAEIGFELIPQYQGQGIMKESLLCILQFGFEELQLSILEGFTHQLNSKSIVLMEKVGFKRQVHGENLDKEMIIYSLTQEDWRTRLYNSNNVK